MKKRRRFVTRKIARDEHKRIRKEEEQPSSRRDPPVKYAGSHPLDEMLTETRIKLKNYEGELQRFALLAAALRVTGLATVKRFTTRSRRIAEQIALYRDREAELVDAVKDCEGISTAQKEVLYAMRRKYGFNSFGQVYGFRHVNQRLKGEDKDIYLSERVTRYQKMRRSRLERLGVEVLVPQHEELTYADAMKAIAGFIKWAVTEVELLHEEVMVNDKDSHQRKVARSLRDTLIRDMAHLGLVHKIKPSSAVGRPKKFLHTTHAASPLEQPPVRAERPIPPVIAPLQTDEDDEIDMT